MRNFTKWLSLLLAVVMVFGIVACTPVQPTDPTNGPTDGPTNGPTGGNDTPTEPTTPPETTAPAEMDYTPYMCPWTAEDLEKARSDGKMHYFFMAGEGIHISRNQQNVDKWGDSTLVVFPNGQLMLIDTAPAAYGPVLLRNLQQMGVEHLDGILVTHPHSDHQNGLTLLTIAGKQVRDHIPQLLHKLLRLPEGEYIVPHWGIQSRLGA